jgi:tetratricopeptide (TPR) repeat protein
VINKVLRDLDQRQAAAGQGANNRAAGDQVMRGTQALTTAKPASPLRLWLVLMAVAFVLLAGLATWWVLSNRALPTPELAPAQVALPAVAQVPASTTVVVPVVAPEAMAPVQIASAALPKPFVPAPAPKAELGATPAPVMAKAPLVLAMPPNAPPPAVPQPALAPALTVTQSKPSSDGLQPGVTQAVAQAQTMWNEGSRTSAIDLLRQALGRVEASSPDGVNGVGFAPVVAIARELARMELAEGQVSNAFKLLVRLEPKISQVADLWAMRANAAQRLGQHAEAAGSYQRALSLKADEPRWMLGLAVSLAAQGQIAQAGDLAEKVRLMGALRPEIASYLRQIGVVIHSD